MVAGTVEAGMQAVAGMAAEAIIIMADQFIAAQADREAYMAVVDIIMTEDMELTTEVMLLQTIDIVVVEEITHL